LLEVAGWELGEAVEGGGAVSVEADVLPVLGPLAAGLGIAIEGNGGAGEIEGAAVEGGDDFDGVGVADVAGGAGDAQGGDLDGGVGEGAEEGGEMFGLQERFVALDVDVDVCGDLLGGGFDAIGAAGEVGRGHVDGPAVSVAEFGDFGGVGGDDDPVEAGAALGGFEDPGEHGLAGDLAEDFAGEAGGGEAGGDDAEDACGREHGLLFGDG